MGVARPCRGVVALRGERLALTRLELGTVDTSPGAPQVELLQLFGLNEHGQIAFYVSFDIEDIDAAIAELDAVHARFAEPHPHARRPENAASRVYEHFFTCFATRDWAALAEMYAEDIFTDDRRRVVGAGVLHGREVNIANMRAVADVGTDNLTTTSIATRGERLALSRVYSPAFRTEVLNIIEIDADERIAAVVAFDPADLDAALEELDARYAAGDAAPQAHTWSVITRSFAALNRRELPPTTPDWVNIDHRRGTFIAPGEMPALLDAAWNLTSDLSNFIVAVHRLTNLGAVITHMAHETSQEGFHAEWRVISVLTLEGDMYNRCEVFDEADLDAALARFEQLSRPAPPPENAASKVAERFRVSLAARDWDAMTEMLAEDFSNEDRRRVVNSGTRHGRDVGVEDLRAAVGIVGITYLTSVVIATRGERLELVSARVGNDERPEALQFDVLQITEIDADEQIAAVVTLDLDDIDAAFEELDARYLTGEAAAHAHTWSVITGCFAALSRHELPSTTPDLVDIDHRRGAAFAPGELMRYLHAGWELNQSTRTYVAVVHRLNNLGAVVTHAAHLTSREGFEAEWRTIDIFTVEGDLINRCEIFDEADIDAALSHFEELLPRTRRLENAASQVAERSGVHFAARDWDAMAETLADDISTDDRRRVVGAGVRRGRDAEIASMRATAEVGTKNITGTVLATRGEHLLLVRVCFSGRDQGSEAFFAEVLGIVQTNADERIAAVVTFDLDDIDAAFEELDTRYLAGEAAPHAQTWSVIARECAAFNRHELPAADWVTIDHRPLVTIDGSDLPATIRATWDLTPDLSIHIEAVHRLSSFGAVVTYTAYGTSPEGLDAEWRMIQILTVDGDLISRCEIFDEADIDAALARFEELDSQARRLENAASQVWERFQARLVAEDWAAMAAMGADDSVTDDRRRVVGAGVQRGRDVNVANIRATLDIGIENVRATVIATRGERLVLDRVHFSGRDQAPEPFHTVILRVLEIDAEERIAAAVLFDPNDIDAAFEELDARYLAGEAAAYSHSWSLISGIYAAFNRHELPAITPDWSYIDHRPLITIEASDLPASIHAVWDLMPDISIYMEAVHRLSDLGAVVTHTARGISHEDFDAEWRMIDIFTVDGDLISRCEMFDEADLDAAIARFAELDRRAPLLENAATRTWMRVADGFNRRDLDSLLAVTSADGRYEHRRKGLRDELEGPARRKAVRAMFETAPSSWRLEVEPIAIRGSRLSLTRECYRDIDDADRPFAVELLRVMELGDGGLIHDTVSFDSDDINGAIGELTVRWIASGQVAHPEVIESVCRLNDIANRHDWDVIATRSADATYVNHRQLANAGADTIADYLSSIRKLASLVPNLRTELAEVLTHSAMGLVALIVLKGTSIDGVAIETPILQLTLLEGDHVTHVEAFGPAQRDLALSRFEELNRSG